MTSVVGIALNKELSCEGIVRSIGNAIAVAVSDMDFSVIHLIPSFNNVAPPKIIVRFTRREVCDHFYSNRENLGSRSRTSLVSDLTTMVMYTYPHHLC